MSTRELPLAGVPVVDAYLRTDGVVKGVVAKDGRVKTRGRWALRINLVAGPFMIGV